MAPNSLNLANGTPQTHCTSMQSPPLSSQCLFDVQGLVAVITGGGSGIGRMMAAALENNGATVYIVGRRMEVLKTTAQEISKNGGIIPLEGDITDRTSLLAMVETVKNRHGYIDLLVNNAGIARNLFNHPLPCPGDSPPASDQPPHKVGDTTPSVPSIKAFQAALWGEDTSPQDFAETFATNVTAVYYTTVAFLDLLHSGNIRKRDESWIAVDPLRPPLHSSQVISVSSSGGFRLDSKVFSPSYTLAKAACTHLGKLLANLLSPWGIRSNVLAPGVFPSEMTDSVFPQLALNGAALVSSVPLKRAGTEEDMAGAILYLASRAGSYVNCAVWLVDGGRVGSLPSSH
ncbi:2OG-Fe oxygenase [Favolaschia claudopus]|uniref:2OG-Fe oxygenase n=1 Tax=Favolaschia claudopus TaxID=2862362 RepID=A0AAW0C2I3_9AGAR